MGNRQFAEMLMRARLRSGITQQQLADLSTVSSRAIRNLEKGHVSHPRRETVQLLAEALRIEDATLQRLLQSAAYEDAQNFRTGFGRGDPCAPDFGLLEDNRDPFRRRDGGISAPGRGHLPPAAAGPSPTPPLPGPQYEYKAVPLPEGAGRARVTGVLNEEGRAGWRLAAVDGDSVYLERRTD
ncbi:helix-turn-helix domain-containing protein [Streptomyces sp. NBC_00433]